MQLVPVLEVEKFLNSRLWTLQHAHNDLINLELVSRRGRLADQGRQRRQEHLEPLFATTLPAPFPERILAGAQLPILHLQETFRMLR